MTSGKISRVWLACSATGLCAAILLLAWFVPGLRPTGLLLRHWQKALAHAPPDQVELLLHHIAGLGDIGLPVVVEALMSGDETRSGAAHRVLQRQLDHWQLLGAPSSVPKVARLVRLLAARAGQGGAEADRRGGELAVRILLWPADRRSPDAENLVADCELLLRRRNAAIHSRLAVEDDTTHPSPDQTSPKRAREGNNASPPLAFRARVSDDRERSSLSPTLNLPVERPGSVPPGALDASVVLQAPSSAGKPPGGAVTAADPVPDQRGRNPEPGLRDAPRLDAVADVPTLAPTEERPLVGPDETSVAPETNESGPLESLPDLAVIRRLAADDPSQVEAARGELKRRGFGDVHLAVATQFAHPSADARLALVDRLPQMAAVDPRPWLVWLTADEDPLVRKAAVAVIATSNDPRLRAQLQQREQIESDPEVLRLVRRVLGGDRVE